MHYCPTVFRAQVVLTIEGDLWSLSNGARLHDVTHLPCRAAKYTQGSQGGKCLPDNAKQSEFPGAYANATRCMYVSMRLRTWR